MDIYNEFETRCGDMKEIFVKKLPASCMACCGIDCFYKRVKCYLDKRHEKCPLRLVDEHAKEHEQEIKKLKAELEFYKRKAIRALEFEDVMQKYGINDLTYLRNMLKMLNDAKSFLKIKGLKSFKSLLED